jgi:conjugal transfer mating pair stabilization protein TraN
VVFNDSRAGTAELIEAPSCANNFTATVMLRDPTQIPITQLDGDGHGDGGTVVIIGYENSRFVGTRITFEIVTLRGEGQWTPQACVEAAQAVDDGVCAHNVNVVRGARTENGCAIVNAVEICPGDELGRHLTGKATLPSLPLMALEAEVVQGTCTGLQGNLGCWTDVNGNQQCFENSLEDTNTCRQYEQDSSCAFVSSSCLDEGQGTVTGTCYVSEEVWDCGYNQQFTDYNVQQNLVCDSDFRCMGTDCMVPNESRSSSFSRTAAILESVNHAGMDTTCTTPGNCSVFNGRPMECKKSIGGIVDCCETPPGVGVSDYLNLISTMGQLDSTLTSHAMGGTWVADGYQALREPVVTGLENVENLFVGEGASLSGSMGLDGLPSVSGIQQTIQNEVVGWIGESFGEFGSVIRDSLFQNVGGDWVLNQALGTVLSSVMLAYSIYSMSKLLIQLLITCESEEFELGVQRELKNCHYVGSYCKIKAAFLCIAKADSYCCFNSPLARIMQQQIRQQIGIDWGSPESPSCQGVAPQLLNSLDWDQIDLGEWEAMMAGAGLGPTKPVDLNSLTTGNKMVGVDSNRQDAATRANIRLQNIDPADRRGEAAGVLKNAR